MKEVDENDHNHKDEIMLMNGACTPEEDQKLVDFLRKNNECAGN